MEFYEETLSKAKSKRKELVKELEKLDQMITVLEDFAISNGQSPEGIRRFSHWTQIDAAIQIIRDKGDWMHVSEIAKKMVDGGIDASLETLRKSLYGTLVRKPEIARHPKGQATFGFRGWLERDHLVENLTVEVADSMSMSDD